MQTINIDFAMLELFFFVVLSKKHEMNGLIYFLNFHHLDRTKKETNRQGKEERWYIFRDKFTRQNVIHYRY